MSWASRRQFFFGAIFFLIVGIIGFLIIFPYFNKAPSCMDGKQNGDESGVDCGGGCKIACNKEVNQINILWARAFKIVDGRYNALAYLENKNPDAAVFKIRYRFRFADKDNVVIGKREGQTYIPPKGKFAIFEPAVEMGNSIPVYTTLEFLEIPVWTKISRDKVDQLNVSASNILLENTNTNPKLSATIKNNSLFYIPEVKVVAILYNKDGNAVSVSQTYLEELGSEESTNVFFTWPQPFFDKVIEKEIIPVFNVFLTRLK